VRTFAPHQDFFVVVECRATTSCSLRDASEAKQTIRPKKKVFLLPENLFETRILHFFASDQLKKIAEACADRELI
jgi:hypothetical protein